MNSTANKSIPDRRSAIKFKLYRNHYCFTIRAWAVVGTLLGLAIFISLGRWQLDRYDEKKTLLDQFNQAVAAKPRPIQTVVVPEVQKHGVLPVSIQGSFDNKHSFLLDNHTYKGRVGYQVLTPVKIPGQKRAVLVNRGWIPLGQNRATLPTIAPVSGSVRLVGLARVQPKPLTLSEQTMETQRWPVRVQAVDYAHVSRLTHYDFYPFVVLLRADQPHGFVREWTIQTLEPQRHLGYAVQWFAMGLVLFIIFVGCHTRKVLINDNE